MVIGDIEGYPVTYNAQTDRATCKDISVSATRMIQAYESSLDRVPVKQDLMLEDTGYMGFTLGCFKVSPEQAQLLIKSLKTAQNDGKISKQKRVQTER